MLVRLVIGACLLPLSWAAIECESNTTYISTARADAVAVNAGTNVVIAGGYTEGDDDGNMTPSDVMDIFRDDDGSGVIKVENMTIPFARSGLTSVAIGDLVLMAGGLDENLDGTNEVYGFSLESGLWEVNTTFPAGNSGLSGLRYGMGAAAAPSTMKAAFAGGYEYDADAGSYIASKDIFIMTPGNNKTATSWKKLTFNTPRVEMLAVGVDKYVFFAGGNTGVDADGNAGTLLSTIEYIDLSYSSPSLKTLSVGLSFPRQDIGGAAVKTGYGKRHLILAGGSIADQDGDGYFTEVRTIDIIDVTDISSPTLKSGTQLEEARADLQAATINDLVFLGPGFAFRKDVRNSVNVLAVYNSSSEHTTHFDLDEYDFDDGRSNYAMTVMYPDKFLLVGGLDDGEVTDEVEILDCIIDDLPDGCDYGDYVCEGMFENSYCTYWNDPHLCYGCESGCKAATSDDDDEEDEGDCEEAESDEECAAVVDDDGEAIACTWIDPSVCECVCQSPAPTPVPTSSPVPSILPTNPPNTDPSPAPAEDDEIEVAGIIGGVAGGLAALGVVAAVYFCCIKKKTDSRDTGDWMSQGQAPPANQRQPLVGADGNQQSYQAAARTGI